MLQNNKSHCSNKEDAVIKMCKFLVVILFVLLVAACGQGDKSATEEGSSQKASDGTTLYLKLVDDKNVLVTNLSQNMTVRVVATLKSADDDAINGEVVEFSTGVGVLSLSNGLTNSNGRSEIQLSSGKLPKAGKITATVSVAGTDITVSYGFIVGGTVDNPGTSPDPDPETGNAEVSSSNDGAIEFVSASPSRITLKSTGGEGLSEFSTVTFKLVGVDGLPMANQTIDFSISNNIGGITIDPTSSTTGFDGLVSTVVRAGTFPTTVRIEVEAVISNDTGSVTLFSESDILSVGVGAPDQNSMSIALSNLAPEAFDFDGEEVEVTIRLADQFNNYVPDGTSVYFTTEGGLIEPSCTTVDSACTVKWVSSNPRPADHRVTILATTLGNESFQDTDSDGVYSIADGEPFTDVNRNGIFDEPFTDETPFNGRFDEPFLDLGGGVYDLGDFFIDYNGNGVFDGDPLDPTGETSFVDSNNGNGLFDGSGLIPAGENSIDINTNSLFDGPGFADLGEPYLDANENNARDVDEYYVDTNNDGEYTQDGDGFFNGIYCKNGEPVCQSDKTQRIRISATLIMASSLANVAITDSTSNIVYFSSIPGILVNSSTEILDLSGNEAGKMFRVYFTDSAGQVLPEGTQVSVSADVGKLLLAPDGFLPNNKIRSLSRSPAVSQSELMRNGLNSFEFLLLDSDISKVENGAIEIEFVTPKGISTRVFIRIRI